MQHHYHYLQKLTHYLDNLDQPVGHKHFRLKRNKLHGVYALKNFKYYNWGKCQNNRPCYKYQSYFGLYNFRPVFDFSVCQFVGTCTTYLQVICLIMQNQPDLCKSNGSAYLTLTHTVTHIAANCYRIKKHTLVLHNNKINLRQ